MAGSNYEIKQGADFQLTLRWETLPIVYKQISASPSKFPLRFTVTSHGLTDNWRVAFVGINGMIQLNAESNPPRASDYHRVTVIDSNTIELNTVNAQNFDAYVSGGYIRYYTAVDMSGYIARMKIRSSKESSTVILELSSTGVSPGIVLDNTNKKIVVTITATQTAAFVFSTAVFDLELISPAGVVTRLSEGTLCLNKEVTYG